jgi:hypothetical protein
MRRGLFDRLRFAREGTVLERTKRWSGYRFKNRATNMNPTREQTLIRVRWAVSVGLDGASARSADDGRCGG